MTMIIPAAERLKSVTTYYFARKLAQIEALNHDGGIPVINLGIGSPDLPPAPEVIQKLKISSTQNDAHKYQSYKGIGSLRNAFSTWYKRHFDVSVSAENEILPLIGSKEGVMHISMAFINPGDEVLVPDPGYPSYSMCTRLAGGTPIPMPLLPELGWKPDLKALRKTDMSRVKIMWINYPNMPTGATADIEFFKALTDFAIEYKILICHDNPYVFLLNDHPISIFNVPQAKECALELLSLSKCYNMAGWRVGAVAGNKAYLDAIMNYKSNMDSGMFKPVQEAATVALGLGNDWIHDLNKTYRERKKIACRLFTMLDLDFDENSAGIFVWGKIRNNDMTAEELSEYILNQYRIFITPGHIFGKCGTNYLRLSLCSPENDIQLAMQRIAANPLTGNVNSLSKEQKL